jgi:hypothetical protein
MRPAPCYPGHGSECRLVLCIQEIFLQVFHADKRRLAAFLPPYKVLFNDESGFSVTLFFEMTNKRESSYTSGQMEVATL